MTGLLGLVFLSAMPAFSAPVKLRLRLHVGDQFNYRTALSWKITASGPAKVPSSQISVQGIEQEAVTDVQSNGTYTILTHFKSSQTVAVVAGKKQSQPGGTLEHELNVNALGKKVLSADEKARMQQASTQLGFDPNGIMTTLEAMPVFPQQAVKVGDEWKFQSVQNLAPGNSIQIGVKSRLLRFTRFAGLPAAVVKSTFHLAMKMALPMLNNVSIQGSGSGTSMAVYPLSNGKPLSDDGVVQIVLSLPRFPTGPSVPTPTTDLGPRQIRMDLSYKTKMIGGSWASGSMRVASAGRNAPGFTSALSLNSPSNAPALGAPNAPVRLWLPQRQGSVPHGIVAMQALPQEVGEEKSQEIGFIAFTVNGRREFMTNAQPYRFTWDTRDLSPGFYRVGVEAFDAYGTRIYRSPNWRIRLRSN
jgi:hypothetical protein